MLTVRSLRLDIYLINTVEHIKVVHIHRTGIGFHGRKHVRQRYTQHLHFITVYIKVELRYLRLQRRRQTGQFFVLGSIIHQCVRRLYQIIKSSLSTGFQLHFKTTRSTQSRYHRRSGKINFTFRIFLEMFFHCIHYLFDAGVLAFFPGFQDNCQFRTPLTASHTRTASCHILYIFDIRILLQVSNGTVGHGTRTFQRSPLRQFKFYLKISLVFYRQETCRDNTMNQQDSNQYHSESTQYPTGMLDSTGYGSYILITANTQPFIDFPENNVFLLPAIRL